MTALTRTCSEFAVAHPGGGVSIQRPPVLQGARVIAALSSLGWAPRSTPGGLRGCPCVENAENGDRACFLGREGRWNPVLATAETRGRRRELASREDAMRASSQLGVARWHQATDQGGCPRSLAISAGDRGNSY